MPPSTFLFVGKGKLFGGVLWVILVGGLLGFFVFFSSVDIGGWLSRILENV